ncbi:MAG: hypothetical protein HYW57_04490 [Ignavibacteriales bacterium]|nr:hypothetical protein [Ignavibacteriales bacterium]
MRYILFFFILVVAQSSFSQTDTLYFDPASGNYIIRYLGTTQSGQDTMVTLTYEPPTAIDPVIQGFVSPTADGKYLYRYRITNGTQAQQNLVEFSLHYDSTVWIESRTPETSWRNYPRKMRDYSDTGKPKPTYTWVWRGDQGLEATWFIDSCVVISDGLPTITASYSQAKTRIWAWPAGGPNQKDTTASDIRMKLLRLEVYPNANVLRKTIGPKLPPTPFVPLSFLGTLISYKHQAFDLGWIKNHGIATSLDQKLDNAKVQLEKGNNTSARNILEAFVNEVEALNKQDGQITNEAYALLKFNTEYLIGKL